MTRRSRRYDIRFMRAMFVTAESEALAAGEDEPGAEHLVIACLGFEEGSARRVFERLGADPDGFPVAVVAQHTEALRSIGSDADDSDIDRRLPEAPTQPRPVMRTAPSAREVFLEVVQIAKRDKSQLCGAYVLMVAARSQHSATARTLTAMGLDPRSVVETAREEVDSSNA